jgi:predicted DNA-binding transcriptional regulator YafY
VQISRLFEIVYLILEKGKVPARELAERFEVTTRTIYRDVESLSAAGIPVYMTKGRNGGLSLLPEFVLDKTVLTQREKDEILSALAGLSATGRDETSGALNKLASLFGDTGYDWIEADFSGWGWSQGLKDSFSLLKESILARRIITFDYNGTKGEKTSRVVEPLKLIFRGQSWYLYAYCRMRCSDRYFKLSRMDKIILGNESFSRKTPERVISSEPGKLEYEMLTVRFRAFPPIHFRIYDEYPHHCIHEQDDGTLIVETVMPRGEWLHSYFLSYGENIEFLEPTELREALMRVIGAMQARYGK